MTRIPSSPSRRNRPRRPLSMNNLEDNGMSSSGDRVTEDEARLRPVSKLACTMLYIHSLVPYSGVGNLYTRTHNFTNWYMILVRHELKSDLNLVGAVCVDSFLSRI